MTSGIMSEFWNSIYSLFSFNPRVKGKSKKGEIESLFSNAYPIYNIDVDLIGWEGPFRSIEDLENKVKAIKEVEECMGLNHVLNTGRIVKGRIDGLHTCKGKIDVSEFKPYHIHWENTINNLLHKNNEIYLREDYENYRRFKEMRGKLRPRYTLAGLYETLKDERLNTKINILVEELETRKYLPSNIKEIKKSIAKRKETKLKLLENAYRRYVSNQ